MSGRFSRLVYVGNLPADIRESEVEDLFYKYGRILDVELKIPPRPPCYCFVEVELAHGGRGPSSSSNERRSGHSQRADGWRYGISRHSEHRGAYGLVDYTNYEDMKYAVKKHMGSPLRSQSRSRSRSRSPKRKRSKSSDRSASKSPSASPAKPSRSRSRSRSASPKQDGIDS